MKIVILILFVIKSLIAYDNFKDYNKEINKFYQQDKNQKNFQNYNQFEKENGYTSFRNKIKETGKIPILDEEVKTPKGDSSMTMP
jgi:hypothetical protein